MKKTFLLFLLSMLIIARSHAQGSTKQKEESAQDTLSAAYLTKQYAMAIEDYIIAVQMKEHRRMDTLWFGKRHFNQPDDFPDIQLPNSIQKTAIILINPDVFEQDIRLYPKRTYINLIGWVDPQHAQFIFNTFTNGFKHTFDFFIDYRRSSYNDAYEKMTSRIEEYHFRADGKVDRISVFKEGRFVGNK